MASHADRTTTVSMPKRRVVLLGASNLTRCFSHVWSIVNRPESAGREILVAMGHGRSYGQASRLFVRRLPGIVECDIWSTIAQNAALPTTALLTDIGNDVFYDVPLDRLLDWVEICLGRLFAAGAEVSMSLPPVCNLPTLSRGRFYAARCVLFPHCRMTYDQAINRVWELHEGLKTLGRRDRVRLIDPRRGWYGLDPIHFTRHGARQAWSELLAPLQPTETRGTHATLRQHHEDLRSARRRPQRRWLLGIEQTTRQPVGCFDNGTTLSIF